MFVSPFDLQRSAMLLHLNLPVSEKKQKTVTHHQLDYQ